MACGPPRRYGWRRLAESFISSLKRVVDLWLSTRLSENQAPAALLKILVYAVHTQDRAQKLFNRAALAQYGLTYAQPGVG